MSEVEMQKVSVTVPFKPGQTVYRIAYSPTKDELKEVGNSNTLRWQKASKSPRESFSVVEETIGNISVGSDGEWSYTTHSKGDVEHVFRTKAEATERLQAIFDAVDAAKIL